MWRHTFDAVRPSPLESRKQTDARSCVYGQFCSTNRFKLARTSSKSSHEVGREGNGFHIWKQVVSGSVKSLLWHDMTHAWLDNHLQASLVKETMVCSHYNDLQKKKKKKKGHSNLTQPPPPPLHILFSLFDWWLMTDMTYWHRRASQRAVKLNNILYATYCGYMCCKTSFSSRGSDPFLSD
jgi:hypothetical protein